jgi:hypothetical protein
VTAAASSPRPPPVPVLAVVRHLPPSARRSASRIRSRPRSARPVSSFRIAARPPGLSCASGSRPALPDRASSPRLQPGLGTAPVSVGPARSAPLQVLGPAADRIAPLLIGSRPDRVLPASSPPCCSASPSRHRRRRPSPPPAVAAAGKRSPPARIDCPRPLGGALCSRWLRFDRHLLQVCVDQDPV